MKTLLIKITFCLCLTFFLETNISNAQFLDSSFTPTSYCINGFEGCQNNCSKVIIQTDGKILAGGDGMNGFQTARLNSDGSFDNGFGNSYFGYRHPGNSYYSTYFTGNWNFVFSDMALDTNGCIIMNVGRPDFFLARMTNSGLLDSTFGTNGMIFNNDLNYLRKAHGISILNDNKILALVESKKSNVATDSIQIWKFKTNGTLDSSFGMNGKAFVTDTAVGKKLAVLPDGKIIVAGNDGTGNFYIYRLTASGILDVSFNATGNSVCKIGGTNTALSSVAIQKDGKILLAGQTINKFLVARILSNGIIDSTFNSTGIITIDFSGSTSAVNAIAIDTFANPNKIILAGYTYFTIYKAIALTRIDLNGNIEAKGDLPHQNYPYSAGYHGPSYSYTPEYSDCEAKSVAVQPDGKIVLGCNLKVPEMLFGGTDQDNYIIRILPNFVTTLASVLSPEIISQNINLYPNPTSNKININTPYNIDNITIYDVYGKVKFASNDFDQSDAINTEGFSKGLYTVVITTDKGTGTKKVAVQ